VADVGHAIRKLGRLREAGIGANLDNFGHGFVPLGYLTQLPFRGIKLDAVLRPAEAARAADGSAGPSSSRSEAAGYMVRTTRNSALPLIMRA
jgi:hypothetical protein